jgi:hypothetical protein
MAASSRTGVSCSGIFGGRRLAIGDGDLLLVVRFPTACAAGVASAPSEVVEVVADPSTSPPDVHAT